MSKIREASQWQSWRRTFAERMTRRKKNTRLCTIGSTVSTKKEMLSPWWTIPLKAAAEFAGKKPRAKIPPRPEMGWGEEKEEEVECGRERGAAGFPKSLAVPRRPRLACSSSPLLQANAGSRSAGVCDACFFGREAELSSLFSPVGSVEQREKFPQQHTLAG